ncbi:MAG TPA: class I SAM-dependent methyltransferase [Membranihabitans sp.]|nr:class I SAM-dependent methyltransferase [Membranihabitans sp.]
MLLDTLLVHPDTMAPLAVDWQRGEIKTDFQGKYQAGFKGQIPFVLPVHEKEKTRSSDLHRREHSQFNYVDHYQKDAVEFDYFEPISNPVDRAERLRLDQMIIEAIPTEATSVLDVGCGNAWLACALVNDNRTVISMDISEHNPVRALERFPHHRHEALIADVYHLPIRESSMPCVVASEIMEHVPDPKLFIMKLMAVLQPGGKLIITTPYNEKIQYHLCVHCNRPTPSHAHLHSFHEKNIQTLIPESVKSFNIRMFSHKYLNRAHLYSMIEKWPFGLWKRLDHAANSLWHRPMRLMLEIVK